MKQIIYLGGKKARNYTAPHEETDVIGDCDWKKGEVKTAGVDYFEHPWGINAIVTPVPIPKKQEGESQKSMLEEIEGVYLNDGTGPMFDYIEDNFILTRKSAATPPDVEQMAEESAGGLTNEGTTFERAEHIAGFKAGYQAGQSAVQDATDNSTTWKVLNNDKVNSILAIIMRICDEEQMIALKECLIRRTPAVQDATPQEGEMSSNEYHLRCAWDRTCEDRDNWKAEAKALAAIKKGLETSLTEALSSLSAAQEENKKLREALEGFATSQEAGFHGMDYDEQELLLQKIVDEINTSSNLHSKGLIRRLLNNTQFSNEVHDKGKHF